MSNSIQETDQEPKNHHHHVNNGGSNSNDSGYELRKDRKKTPKVKETSEMDNNNNCFVVLDKLCKECGKGFKSWKALFGHMKCHSKKVSNKLNQESWISRLDDENSGTKSRRIKKSRSRNKTSKRYVVSSTSTTVTTTTTITAASSSICMNTNNNNNNNNHGLMSVFSDIELDQESEIAMCLMMLSRDEGEWGNDNESSDHCKSSAFVRLTKTDGQKPIKNGSKIKKSVKMRIGVHDLGRSEVGLNGLEKIMIENDGLDDEIELGFGLGGHKASHKKLKEVQDSKTEGENIIEHKPLFNHEHMLNGFSAKPFDNHNKIKKFNLGVGSLKKTVMLGAYECQICLKVFSSGQALGGHKRSHMTEKVNEPIREIRGFLDLNMIPDTMEEDVVMKSGTTGYKPWHLADTTSHEPTTLLGFL